MPLWKKKSGIERGGSLSSGEVDGPPSGQLKSPSIAGFADVPPQSSPREQAPSPRSQRQQHHAAAGGGGGEVDAVMELQTQLQAAVTRCNTLEGRVDRALRDAQQARQLREEYETAAEAAQQAAARSEREAREKEQEAEGLRVALLASERKREEQQRELDEERGKTELLSWKLQEAESQAAGLRALAAQADSAVELAKAEIAAIEARADELVRQAREEAAEARERVTVLEVELVGAREKVELAEFRMSEEVARADALVAEADELATKLQKAEDRILALEKELSEHQQMGKGDATSPQRDQQQEGDQKDEGAHGEGSAVVADKAKGAHAEPRSTAERGKAGNCSKSTVTAAAKHDTGPIAEGLGEKTDDTSRSINAG